MNIVVERLNATDVDDLIELEHACFEYHWSRDQFLLGLERGAFIILGTRSDGVLSGYIAISIIKDEMEILNLAVRSEFRKHGLATALLKHAFTICRESGVAKGFLDVKVSNDPAIELYRKFGYKQIGVRKKYYPDTKEDALLFRVDFV